MQGKKKVNSANNDQIPWYLYSEKEERRIFNSVQCNSADTTFKGVVQHRQNYSHKQTAQP